jgi:hypothetical protein
MNTKRYTLYWRFVRKCPWNEERQVYEPERTVVEVDLYDSKTKLKPVQIWHDTLPEAERCVKQLCPVEYNRIQGMPPGTDRSWSGVDT